MIDHTPPIAQAWSARWARLARAAGIDPDEKLTVALSGGADSVLLLQLIAAASPRPTVRAVHADHGLRGAASRADAAFCRNLCRSLGVPFREVRLDLDGTAPSLEARARRARYEALREDCRRTGHRTLVTGHHSDDALETLLMRWIRGTTTPGLVGPRARLDLRSSDRAEAAPVRVVRPLLGLRREEVRRLLKDRGLRWREDASNQDPRFTRNRVREGFLPALRHLWGDQGVENLRAFGRAVEGLEDRLAAATAHLAWAPTDDEAAGGGTLDRAALMALASPLRRRALWRLLAEGTGRGPGRRLLALLLEDLATGRCTRRSLPGDWSLWLRSAHLHLVPPAPVDRPRARTRRGPRQGALPFASTRPLHDPGVPAALLEVPGIRTLDDGRRLSAELLRPAPGTPPPTSHHTVELDATGLRGPLELRYPWPGARFRPLGASGSRRLVRFLADRGVPREVRATIPLVTRGDEILWVVGHEPGERFRVTASTRERLRLSLHDPQR